MKGTVNEFLRNLALSSKTQFFKNERILFFFTLLSFFIICPQDTSAQDKSFSSFPVSKPQFQVHREHGKIVSVTDSEDISVDDDWKDTALKHFIKEEVFKEQKRTRNRAVDIFQFQESNIRNALTSAANVNTRAARINAVNVFEFESRKTNNIKSYNLSQIDALEFTDKNRSSVSFISQSNPLNQNNQEADDPPKVKSRKQKNEGFQWRPAIQQMLMFLAVQHGYALTQPKTRDGLKGKFFKDYIKSVKSLHGWDDGGRFFTNYIAHPMQGSFTGFIQIHNDPKGKKQRFGLSGDYWKSRLKAMAWTAAWSTQFEIGPISQASIGNVGLKGKQTYVDLVVTPTIGTAMLITEDAIDRFAIEWLEGKTKNYYLMIFSRIFLNPTRTMANLIRFKLPWYRDRPRIK